MVVHDPVFLFYNDLGEEEQQHWASKLHLQSFISVRKPQTYEGHKYHPLTYLFCTNDQGMPLEVQKGMAEKSGIEYDSETCDAGHSPWLSRPEVVLGLIKKAAGESH